MSSNTESLMRGAMEAEAFAHRLTLLRIESEHRLALYLARFKPAQDAAPAAAVAHAPPTFAAPPAPLVAQPRPASGAGAASQPPAQEPTSDRFLDRK